MIKYINGDKLYNKLDDETENGDGCFNVSKYGVLEIVEQMPTEDVAPVVHAHWIADGNPYYDAAKCSHCGVGSIIELEDENFAIKYCPHCGAKMDEGNKNA